MVEDFERCVHVQPAYTRSSDHLTCQSVLWQHAFYSVLNDALWICVKKLTCSPRTKTTHVTRVLVILLLIQLVTSQHDFVCIDDDNIITTINVWCVSWFVLTAKYGSNASCQTTKGLTFCVNHEPLALYGLRICYS